MNINKQFDILYNVLNQISPITFITWQKSKKYFSTKSLNKGDHLFLMEDKVTDFYFLIKGLARYYYLNEDGKEFNKSFAEKQGHLISSISSVSHGLPSPFSVEILSEFITLHISYKNILILCEKNIEWNNLLLRIYENLVIKKEKREASFLLLDAKQRYEIFLEDYSMISNIVHDYHIASYLGITNVSLSRIRKEMKLT